MARVALAALLFCALPVVEAEPRESALIADAALPGLLISGIRGARSTITGAYYLFKIGRGSRNIPAQVAAELVAAARRGVEVTILLEGKNPVGRTNRATALFLARGGVKVLFPSGRGAAHVKALVIDDRLLFLGSHNLTQSALSRNSELSLLVQDPALAREVHAYLNRLAARSSYLAVPRVQGRERR
ncbi:phospholipase D-like domain-containing protein [Geomonas sp. RF6]|uniref:phospholipase D-like domain-containing protein n=1 Tax=Geomonas sp. RF6 TaxID=2897342 RepID=UPI001E53C157|nr:phospholipase D-like domain-containing protein [Geomonas sp. RF6]UFS71828.1 phospholipase D-like domain-containing protein [Geomonas sp. RF6]